MSCIWSCSILRLGPLRRCAFPSHPSFHWHSPVRSSVRLYGIALASICKIIRQIRPSQTAFLTSSQSYLAVLVSAHFLLIPYSPFHPSPSTSVKCVTSVGTSHPPLSFEHNLPARHPSNIVNLANLLFLLNFLFYSFRPFFIPFFHFLFLFPLFCSILRRKLHYPNPYPYKALHFLTFPHPLISPSFDRVIAGLLSDS